MMTRVPAVAAAVNSGKLRSRAVARPHAGGPAGRADDRLERRADFEASRGPALSLPRAHRPP